MLLDFVAWSDIPQMKESLDWNCGMWTVYKLHVATVARYGQVLFEWAKNHNYMLRPNGG